MGGWGGGEGSEKKCLGGLKEFMLWIIAWGVYYVSCQKDSKIKHVDLGLF